MLEPFDPRWHGGVAAMRGRFDRRQVDKALGEIVKGRLPEDFYTLPRGAKILALGFGVGVRILRLATWGESHTVVCVEPDPLRRADAKAVIRTCDARGITVVERVEELTFEAGSQFDLLLVEPSYAHTHAIVGILARYRVTSVVGAYDPTHCSDGEIYRICSAGASRFNMLNEHSGHRVLGSRRTGPDISVVVVVGAVGDQLARTIRSLQEQLNVQLEVLLAPADDAAQLEVADLPSLSGLVSGNLRAQGWFPSVPAALAAAAGSYVALVNGGDVCDPTMFASMFDEAAPGREDIALCAYRQVQYSDGAVHLRYLIGPRTLDLRAGPRVCAPGTLDALDLQPVLGRCLYRRAFLQAVTPVWNVAFGAYAPMAFQAQCLFAAARIVTIGSAYLEHWETAAEMTGQRYRLASVAEVRHIFAGLAASLMERDGNYSRELALRGLLARLYIALYDEQTRMRGRWGVSRAMLSDCLASMQFGSQTEFALRGLRRLVGA